MEKNNIKEFIVTFFGLLFFVGGIGGFVCALGTRNNIFVCFAIGIPLENSIVFLYRTHIIL